MKNFKANGLPLLIGSLPMDSHEEAIKLVFEHTPEIPLWVQLPRYREEGMIDQFLSGLPGFTDEAHKNILDTSKPGFDAELIAYFEDYLFSFFPAFPDLPMKPIKIFLIPQNLDLTQN